MKEHSSWLTPGEMERLAIIAEECGEVVQAVGKIIRHGYESDFVGPTNREQLEKELGDVLYAINLMAKKKDINLSRVQESSEQKAEKIKPYLHHQEG